MNIYVGNLPYSLSQDDLKALFEQYGEVDTAAIIMDRQTNRSKGFGFVEMADDAAGNEAIEALHESEVGGRKLTVSVARPKAPRSPRAA